MKKPDIENLLNECLERLLKGETVEQCLSRYPEQAAELRSLLQTALAIKKASAIEPRPEFRARARAQFHMALREMEEKKEQRWSFGWRPQWAITVLAALAVLFLGSGTIAAAGYSMPDSPLYPVKRATEEVQLVFTFSDIDKAELNTRLADKRVDEIIYMAYKGDAETVEVLSERLDNNLVMVANLAGGGEVELAAPSDEAPQIMMAPAAVPAPAAETAPTTPPAPAPQAPAFAPEPPGKVRTFAEPPSEEKPEIEAAKAPETEEKKPVTGAAGGKVDEREELKVEVERDAAQNIERLRAALNATPEPAKKALLQAIQSSEERYQKAIQAVEKGKNKK